MTESFPWIPPIDNSSGSEWVQPGSQGVVKDTPCIYAWKSGFMLASVGQLHNVSWMENVPKMMWTPRKKSLVHPSLPKLLPVPVWSIPLIQMLLFYADIKETCPSKFLYEAWRLTRTSEEGGKLWRAGLTELLKDTTVNIWQNFNGQSSMYGKNTVLFYHSR